MKTNIESNIIVPVSSSKEVETRLTWQTPQLKVLELSSAEKIGAAGILLDHEWMLRS